MEDKIVFNKGFARSYEGDVLMNYEAFNDMMLQDISQNNLTDPRLSYDYYLTEYDYHIMDSEPEYDEWGDHMVSETLIYAYKESENYYMSMNGIHYLGNFSGYMDGTYYISTEERRKLQKANRWLYEYIDDVVFGRNTKEERLKKEAEEQRQQELSSLGIQTQNERDVFKTFSEMNQYEIINQASIRQKYIDQSQSLNIMVKPSTSVKDINALHIYAWENDIKTLYYQHSTNAAQALFRSSVCLACEA